MHDGYLIYLPWFISVCVKVESNSYLWFKSEVSNLLATYMDTQLPIRGLQNCVCVCVCEKVGLQLSSLLVDYVLTLTMNSPAVRFSAGRGAFEAVEV